MRLPFTIRFHIWRIKKIDELIKKLKEGKKLHQEAIGKELKEERRIKMITAREVAEKIGTSRATVSMIERGNTSASEETLLKILKAIHSKK